MVWVHNIGTALIPSSTAESVIHYGDLIWDTCPAILGEGEVIKRSSHETACHVIMYLNVKLELALVAIQKCLVLLHDYLGPNTKKLWLHTQTRSFTVKQIRSV